MAKKVLFLASEKEGLVKTGGLADVVRALPAHLKKQGLDVRVMIPCYRDLLAQNFPMRLPALSVSLNGQETFGCAVRQTLVDDVQVYLLEHNVFYDRGGLYQEGGYSYEDNALRFALLCKAAIGTCEALDWYPDVLHCNDWQTAISPYYLRQQATHHAAFRKTRSVITIHNGLFQGHAPFDLKARLGITDHYFVPEIFEDYGRINLLKGGIALADAVTTVSPGYRDELLVPETSHGLWQSYAAKGDQFVGILNGCDYGQWNPETDPVLPANFSDRDRSGKARCKDALQRSQWLQPTPAVPLLGMVSRLSEQKGFHYLVPALTRYLHMAQSESAIRPVQVVVLGDGDQSIATQLQALVEQFPGTFSFTQGYNDALSHQIEAGIDFFLMPSSFEPCGLNQIYSLRYGSLPIVRATGGLRDTVTGLTPDYANSSAATGISFDERSEEACFNAIVRAVNLWYDAPELYQAIQVRAMQQDFSWFGPAAQFLQLYQGLMA